MSDIESIYQAATKEHQAGRLDAAAALYGEVLNRDRLFARAWHMLGVALYQGGDIDTALEYIERAIGLESQWSVFYRNLGTIYAVLGRTNDAEAVLMRAIELQPEDAEALRLLGHLWCLQNRSDEAVSLFRQALQLNPNDAAAHAGLGHAYSESCLVEESIAAYRRANDLSGNASYRVLAATQLPLVYSSRAELWRWRQRLSDEIDALLAAGVVVDLQTQPAAPIFSLPHQGFNDLEIQRKLARLYRAPPLPPGVWRPREGPRIRVGFLSGYFGVHTIGKLARGLIARLSRNEFHVTLFSIGQHHDAIGLELAASADRYVVIPHDLRLARRAILEQAVDVLVFTEIGIGQTACSLAHSRLAPVQCATWGHPETTGLETIDYFVSSDLMETRQAQAHYSERLIRLPSLTFYFHRSQLPPEPAPREAFG